MQHFHQNAFTHRLERVHSCWTKARKSEEGLIYRWLVKRDEISMIDGFYKIETTEHGYTDDIFLRFYTPFSTEASYSERLLEELCTYWQQQKESFAAMGLPTNWSYDACAGNQNRLEVFFYNLSNLRRSMQMSNCLVVFLSPDAVEAPATFEKWLGNAMHSLQPGQLCLMLIDEDQQPLLKKLPKKFPRQVPSLQPRLEMQKAIAQVAASGNPDAPDTLFRKYYLQLADAATKQDLAGLKQWGHKALQVGEGPAWFPVRVGVWMLMAGAYTHAHRYSDALSHYEKGHQQALQLQETFPEQGRKMSAQCLAGQGNIYFIKKEYKAAIEAYGRAAREASAGREFLYAMEGWRMAANSALRLRQPSEALDFFRQALEAGRLLPRDVQQHSTFPLIAEQTCELSLDAAEKLNLRQLLDQLQPSARDSLQATPLA